eukprot:1322214-Rhodomonas_salina.1
MLTCCSHRLRGEESPKSLSPAELKDSSKLTVQPRSKSRDEIHGSSVSSGTQETDDDAEQENVGEISSFPSEDTFRSPWANGDVAVSGSESRARESDYERADLGDREDSIERYPTPQRISTGDANVQEARAITRVSEGGDQVHTDEDADAAKEEAAIALEVAAVVSQMQQAAEQRQQQQHQQLPRPTVLKFGKQAGLSQLAELSANETAAILGSLTEAKGVQMQHLNNGSRALRHARGVKVQMWISCLSALKESLVLLRTQRRTAHERAEQELILEDRWVIRPCALSTSDGLPPESPLSTSD